MKSVGKLGGKNTRFIQVLITWFVALGLSEPADLQQFSWLQAEFKQYEFTAPQRHWKYFPWQRQSRGRADFSAQVHPLQPQLRACSGVAPGFGGLSENHGITDCFCGKGPENHLIPTLLPWTPSTVFPKELHESPQSSSTSNPTLPAVILQFPREGYSVFCPRLFHNTKEKLRLGGLCSRCSQLGWCCWKGREAPSFPLWKNQAQPALASLAEGSLAAASSLSLKINLFTEE